MLRQRSRPSLSARISLVFAFSKLDDVGKPQSLSRACGHAGTIWIKKWSHGQDMAARTIYTVPNPANATTLMTISCQRDHGHRGMELFAGLCPSRHRALCGLSLFGRSSRPVSDTTIGVSLELLLAVPVVACPPPACVYSCLCSDIIPSC